MENKNVSNSAEELKENYLKGINAACAEQKKSISAQTEKVKRLRAKVVDCEKNAGKLEMELDKLNSQAAREIAESRPIDGIQKDIRKMRLALEDMKDLQTKLSGEILPGEEQTLKQLYDALQRLFITKSVALRQNSFDQRMDELVIELGDLTVAYDVAYREAVAKIGVKIAWGTSVHEELGKVSYFSEEAQRKIGIVFA